MEEGRDGSRGEGQKTWATALDPSFLSRGDPNASLKVMWGKKKKEKKKRKKKKGKSLQWPLRTDTEDSHSPRYTSALLQVETEGLVASA